MRVGRSLSPGKVFFERNGVLQKVDAETLKGKVVGLAKSGWHSLRGVLMQWGVSENLVVVDDVVFPVPFLDPPQVQVDTQRSRAVVSHVTTTGFRLITSADSIRWSAFGVAPR